MIRHSKVDSAPPSSDRSKIDSVAWNEGHLITDPVAVSGAIGIHVVSGDPNGVLVASMGELARDTTLGQLWINTAGSATWTPFVRADGGTATVSGDAWGFLGDSGINSQGVNTDNAVRWNNVVSGSSAVPDARAVLNTIYSTASSEPLTMVDLGTTDLRAHNVGSPPGYGWEFSFGRTIFDLISGVGASATAGNKPWLLVAGISGVELKQTLPASTYGTSSPALGGLNWYNFVKARWQALLATSGRKLAGIFFGSLGGNDATNSPDANAVAANMATLATQLRADFGSQLAIIWLKVHAQANIAIVPFRDTVRAQQVTGIATIPNSRLLSIDSYSLLSDLLHWGANDVYDMGLQQAEAARQMRGIVARTVTQPTVIGYGTPDFNKAAGALTPHGDPLARHGDLEFAFVAATKESGTAVASSTWTASGWTLSASGAQAIGGLTQEFALFTRQVLQADLDANGGLPATFSCTTGNDDNCAVRVCVRGLNPFPSVDGSIVSYAATAFGTSGVSAGGVTTTGINDLVLVFICGFGGGASPTEHFTVSNATIGAAILIDAPLTQATTNFGLLAVATGVKATAGATGTTTVTPSISSNPSGFTVAIKA